jgi:hypothetical protein
MNRRLLLARLVFAVVLIGMAGACRRSESRGGSAPITGKPSDPAVTFVARWDDTNAFAYHLETITGTQVPRRNSDAVVQQDTVLAQDLRLNINAITRDGVRSLQMEVQTARVETTSDQRLTSAFDTENEMLATEDNTIASRLRRAKGARLIFRLAPDNRVVRVDGIKEFNDRTGSGRNVRGAAGSVVNKFFGQQFYRDVVEMSFLPTNAVHVGDSWIVHLRNGPGLFNNSATDLTYTFRGWQVHEGTNCARFDFAGGAKSAGTGRKGSSEDAEIEGTVWFSPEMGVPVEMTIDQTVVKQSIVPPPGSNPPTTARLTRTVSGTNGGRMVVNGGRPQPGNGPAPTTVLVESDDDVDTAIPAPAPGSASPDSGTAAPPVATRVATVKVTGGNPPSTPPPPGEPGSPGSAAPSAPANNGPAVTRTTTIKQHLTLTLIELVPIDPPTRPSSN